MNIKLRIRTIHSRKFVRISSEIFWYGMLFITDIVQKWNQDDDWSAMQITFRLHYWCAACEDLKNWKDCFKRTIEKYRRAYPQTFSKSNEVLVFLGLRLYSFNKDSFYTSRFCRPRSVIKADHPSYDLFLPKSVYSGQGIPAKRFVKFCQHPWHLLWN